jgi:hypothetical protein
MSYAADQKGFLPARLRELGPSSPNFDQPFWSYLCQDINASGTPKPKFNCALRYDMKYIRTRIDEAIDRPRWFGRGPKAE